MTKSCLVCLQTRGFDDVHVILGADDVQLDTAMDELGMLPGHRYRVSSPKKPAKHSLAWRQASPPHAAIST